LFIHEDVLAVFGTEWTNDYSSFWSRRFYAYDSKTFINIYNIKNRSKPKLINTIEVSGDYFDGRKL